MIQPFPLAPLPKPASAWIVSSQMCDAQRSYDRYQPVGSVWVRAALNSGKSAFLSISQTDYIHSSRPGAVDSALCMPDGSIWSLERDRPGPLSRWEFADQDAFLRRDGTHQPAKARDLARVGDAVFGVSGDAVEGKESGELMVLRQGEWEFLGERGRQYTDVHAISDDTLLFDELICRWKDNKLTRLAHVKPSYCDNVVAHVDQSVFVLSNRVLHRFDPDEGLVHSGWTVSNLMGIWGAGGLIFAVLGNNKRSWVAALYDPQTGKTRGFKRKDFALGTHEGSNQWISTQGRLFFLNATKHFEVDLAKVSALRRTKLKS